MFDISIFTLKRALAKAAIDDPCPICDYEAAIRLLEAAGRVDKQEAINLLDNTYDHFDSWSEIIDTLKAVVAALPGPVQGEKKEE